MLKVGITGGIGSGKSTISKIFEILGVPVFYADETAKVVMHTDETLKQGIVKAFGEQAYLPDGQLNRKYLAGIIFNDQDKLEQLNALVHPAVFKAFDVWLDAQNQHVPYIIKEAAVLFESLSYKKCDYSILITSPLELRIKRVMQRDGVSRDNVLQRMDNQLSDGAKAELADFILVNDEQQLLIPQLLNLHTKLLTLAKR